MFSTLRKPNFNVSFSFTLSSANPFNLHQSKDLSFGKELTQHFLPFFHNIFYPMKDKFIASSKSNLSYLLTIWKSFKFVTAAVAWWLKDLLCEWEV